jgi:hypothetical protein
MARNVVHLVLTVLVLLATSARAETRSDAPSRENYDPGFPVRETKYYRVHTDLELDFARDLERRLDGMYEEYRRRLSMFDVDNTNEKMEVYLFKKKADYLRFAGGGEDASSGKFIPGRNALVSYLQGQGRDEMRQTLQHEAFHQFAFHAISKGMPLWLNEGIAQVFEEAIWTGDGFLLGQVPPWRVRQLKNDMKDKVLIPFEELMAISHDRWRKALAGSGTRRASVQYNQSWAMVHFLIQAKDPGGDEKYRRRLIRMLQLMHEGKDGDAAFREAFSANVAGFQSLFVAYANTLEPTPEATMIERQEVLGDMLLSFTRHKWKIARLSEMRDAAAKTGFSMTYGNRHGMSWSTDRDVRVYFSDSHNRVLDDRDLYLDARPGAPLPDIVCHATDRLQLRTRFHRSTDEGDDRPFDREVLVESPGTPGRGN